MERSVRLWNRFFFVTGMILLGSEAGKQLFLTFSVGKGHYLWWYFPFQLCSIPMYLLPLLPFLKGEKQVAYADRKIRQLRQMINERGLDTKIGLDGRISPDNIRTYGKDLADVFVTGTTCLDRNDLSGSFDRLEQLRREIL